MLETTDAVKVSVYLSDGARHNGAPIYPSLVDFLFHAGIAGATVFKGVAGFGHKHRIHSAHLLEISDHLPVVVQFVETQEKVYAILPAIRERVGSALIELEPVRILAAGEPRTN